MPSRRGSVLGATAIVAGLLAYGSAPAAATAQACAGTASSMTRIGNTVFDDADDNGTFDLGETGLDGVVVELWLDVDDDASFEPNGDDGTSPRCTTVTSGGGHYWFSDIDPDHYFVAIPSAPAGYRSSTGADPADGIDHRDDGEAFGGYAAVGPLLDLTVAHPLAEFAPDGNDDETAADVATAPAVFADEFSDLTIDFGFAPVPCLGVGNRVWLDADADGQHDASEDGIDGVSMELYRADTSGSPTGTVLDTVTTSDGGYYLFACQDAGEYVVVIPASNLAVGAALDGLGSTIDGVADTDRQDDGIDPVTDTDRVISRMVTLLGDAQPAGEADKPAGTTWGFDLPSDTANDTTIDFGFVDRTPVDPATSSLGDYVWVDEDRDGVQDQGESPVVGVTLRLLDDAGAEIGSTATDGDGRYRFAGLGAGTYSVCYVASTLPPGVVATAHDAGTDDDDDSDFDSACAAPVALGASVELVTVDLGLVASNVDLAITKAGIWSADSDALNWSIAVRNLGSQQDPGSIIVTDIVAAGLGTPTITAPSGMSCNYDTDTRAITCTSTSPLPAGAALAINVVTPRTNTDLCSVSNTATVRGAAIDATTANNVATATVSVDCGRNENSSSTLPNTGGTVLLVSFAAIFALSGHQLLRLSDRARQP